MTDDTKGTTAARHAGRGGVAVLGAKIFFVLSGLVQQTLLPRVIGLAGYGALARVLALANVVNNVVVASSVQAVSRTVAGARGRETEALKATLRVQVPLAVLLAASFAIAAPWLAAFEGAPHIAKPLMLMALVVLLYGVYAPLIGLFNGRAQFTRQAALDVTFAVLRSAGLLGVGFLFARGGGSGVLGSTLGFVAAAACIVPIAARWVKVDAARDPGHDHDHDHDLERQRPRPRQQVARPRPRPADYLRLLWPLAVAQFFTNAVMQVDITLLGRFLSHSAPQDALGAKSADEWVAVYRACQLFAFLPYQLLISVTQVLFPMLARAKADGDVLATTRYVVRGARIAAVACGMMVAVVVAMPASLLAFAFPAEVADRGASTLRILALGQGAYTMLGIATTVLASLGRERTAARVSATALAAVVIACFALVARAPFGEAQLHATAIATSAALAAALGVAAFLVRAETGAFVPLATAIRVALAVALAFAAGSFLPRVGKLAAPAVAIAVAAGYLLVLLVTREVTRDDASALAALRKRA